MIISAGKSSEKSGLRLERKLGFPHWTAGFFLSGLTEIVIGEQTWEVSARQAVIIPPHTAYTLTLKKRQNEVWMIFDPGPHLLEVLHSMPGKPAPFAVSFPNPELWNAVRGGLRDLLRWWNATEPQLRLAENAMDRVLLLAAWARGQQLPSLPDERIGRAVAYINDRLAEELSGELLARVAGLSASRFAFLFKEHTGLAPMKFLEMRRIEKAKHLLLTTSLPVQQVALRTGFPNAQHFSTCFRYVAGQSPSAFRARPERRFAELNPPAATRASLP